MEEMRREMHSSITCEHLDMAMILHLFRKPLPPVHLPLTERATDQLKAKYRIKTAWTHRFYGTSIHIFMGYLSATSYSGPEINLFLLLIQSLCSAKTDDVADMTDGEHYKGYGQLDNPVKQPVKQPVECV